MAGSKNNPASHGGSKVTKRFYNGVECKPILYDGRWVGKGKIMAAECNKEIVLDVNGMPVPYKSLPTQ
jgi:hypothetical protein